MSDDRCLNRLESESIFIVREAFAKVPSLAMLWSMGKDSTVLLWLVRRAFLGRVPFPLVHIDTSYKIPEMIAFRDRVAREWDLRLIIRRNEAVLDQKRTFPEGRATRVECCAALKKDALRLLLDERRFNGLLVEYDATRSRLGRRSGTFRLADPTWNGKSAIRRPSSGTTSKRSFRPEHTCAYIPSSIGPSSTSGRYIRRENIPVLPLVLRSRNGGALSVTRVRPVHVSCQIHGPVR